MKFNKVIALFATLVTAAFVFFGGMVTFFPTGESHRWNNLYAVYAWLRLWSGRVRR